VKVNSSNRGAPAGKRAFDLAVASIALLLGSPVIALAALLIKLDSPGPVLHRAIRVGLGGHQFQLLKLRTMVAGAERMGPAVTTDHDPRVTRAGRWLRRLKVDELPQFLNVLSGDMSVVGPRPEHPDYVARYTEAQRGVLAVRPGITSPASLAYSDEEYLLTGDSARVYLEDVMPAKLALDLQYVRSASVAVDLKIVGRTAALILGRAIHR
jgi:lipopolysaccharide/colanic/teichoic acid biosynthesis glycosyltransferase